MQSVKDFSLSLEMTSFFIIFNARIFLLAMAGCGLPNIGNYA